MKRWAVIRNGQVENIAVWDGASAWTPPEGTTVRELGRTEVVGPGWRVDGDHFTPPEAAPAAASEENG